MKSLGIDCGSVGSRLRLRKFLDLAHQLSRPLLSSSPFFSCSLSFSSSSFNLSRYYFLFQYSFFLIIIFFPHLFLPCIFLFFFHSLPSSSSSFFIFHRTFRAFNFPLFFCLISFLLLFLSTSLGTLFDFNILNFLSFPSSSVFRQSLSRKNWMLL